MKGSPVPVGRHDREPQGRSPRGVALRVPRGPVPKTRPEALGREDESRGSEAPGRVQSPGTGVDPGRPEEEEGDTGPDTGRRTGTVTGSTGSRTPGHEGAWGPGRTTVAGRPEVVRPVVGGSGPGPVVGSRGSDPLAVAAGTSRVFRIVPSTGVPVPPAAGNEDASVAGGPPARDVHVTCTECHGRPVCPGGLDADSRTVAPGTDAGDVREDDAVRYRRPVTGP